MSLVDREFFTRKQLQKVHRQFAHPLAEKLHKLIKIARPEHIFPKALKSLQDLFRKCEASQSVKNAPYRFRVSMGTEDVRFNTGIAAIINVEVKLTDEEAH